MSTNKCDIFILGSSGMLGNTLLRYFESLNQYKVIGSIRGTNPPAELNIFRKLLCNNLDVEDEENLFNVLSKYQPKIVINCIGVVKQLSFSKDPIKSIVINSLLPHKLSEICKSIDSRLIQISTDCVFSGKKGMYSEFDNSDAQDLYGKTKFLGEVVSSNDITLRTSIIGHELETSHSLLEWFLSQENEVKGFRKAIFSGLPTIELARIIHKFIIPNRNLKGLYHVSSDPIDKFTLLNLISEIYRKEIKVTPDDNLIIDRSLSSKKFKQETGFVPLSWENMIHEMHKFR